MTSDSRESSYDLAPEGKMPSGQSGESPKKQRTEAGPLRTCQYCGFSFHGAPKARCPECAAPMETGESDLLKFADPAWVRRVSMGAVLVVAAVAVHAVASGEMFWARLQRVRAPVSQTVLHTAAALFMVVACWIVTKRDPRAKVGKNWLAINVRAAAVTAAVVWCVAGMMRLQVFEWSDELNRYLLVFAMASQGALAAFLGHYFGGLAGRLPDDGLARHSVNSGGVAAIACGLLMVIQWLGMTSEIHVMFFTCSFPLVAGVLAIFVWAGITALRLAMDMRVSANAGDVIRAKRAERMAGMKTAR